MYYGSETVAYIANEVTLTHRASRQLADADTVSGGRTSWPPSWKYDLYQKSDCVIRCIFTWRI